MKTLLVLRHAKSSWKDADREDIDRPLNKRGKRDVPRMAEFILTRGLCPDVILSSPARRARKTAEAVNRVCGEAVLALVENLYPGGAADYVEALRDLDDSIVSAMVVGHNPGLEEWLGALGVEVEKFPTAALAHIELPIDGWDDLNVTSAGELRGCWTPREI